MVLEIARQACPEPVEAVGLLHNQRPFDHAQDRLGYR